MKSFICLALSCLLIGLLYVYMRQQFAAQNMQINQLKQLVTTMAQEFQPGHCKREVDVEVEAEPEGAPTVKVVITKEDRVTVSDDSESEDDESDEEDDHEDDHEDEHEDEDDHVLMRNLEPVIKLEKVGVGVDVGVDVETKEEEPKIEIDELSENEKSDDDNEPIVLDISEQTKTINLFDDPPPAPKKVVLDKLSAKELKEMVTSKGGPLLKTKKEMIEFLEKI